jgi:hypothetical protein
MFRRTDDYLSLLVRGGDVVPDLKTYSEQASFEVSSQVPVLMERYIAAVERIMSSYGFDPHKCQFGAPEAA